MAKTISEEIVSYLNENDMYFIEEYDKEGFPINDEANDLVGYMTNAELCEHVTDAMEYIADIQRKIDIEKVCRWLENNYSHFDGKTEDFVMSLRKAMEAE